MNALKIFSENFVTGDCGYTLSSGLAPYLYDQNQDTTWSSVGSSDATEESIEIIFKNWQGTESTRTFDRIILLNHNIKAGAFDYWDSIAAEWVVIAPAALSAIAAPNTLIELVSPVTASRVRFRPYTTQVANAEKYVGELKICQSIITGTQLWRSDFPRADDQKSGSYRTGEGRLVFWREWTRFGASGGLYDVAKTDHDILLPYLKATGFLTIVFWDDFDLTECFEVAITSAPQHRLNRKTQLYEIDFDMEER